MQKTLVYLADLVHNSVAKGPFPMPLNIGCIGAYAKKQFGDDIELRLFKYPQALVEAVKQRPPQIMGFSNLAWNSNLSYKMAEFVRSVSPCAVTVFGGPNFPIDLQKERDFLAQRPELDFYVKGPGEVSFSRLIAAVRSGTMRQSLREQPQAGCASLHPGTGELLLGEPVHLEALDDAPSPYLSGLLDEFFEDNFIPILETDRGCPYSCTFCAWEQGKVKQFSIERIKAELDYVADRVKHTNLLFFGQANFGMFERDREIVDHIVALNQSKGYPRHIYAEWAKNTSTRVIEMAEKLGDIAEATMAFQSLDPQVLANIGRENIRLSDAMAIQKHFSKRKIPTYSDLILGLPGETRETHLAALRQLFDAGIWHIVAWNCQTLKGSILESTAQREKFGLRTKYRLYDIGFGRYDGMLAIEHEEVVRATDSMSEEEILWFRPVHWLIHFLGREKYPWQLLKYLDARGIHPVDFILRVLSERESAPAKVREIFGQFAQEARDEWFDTPQALYEHYGKPENFDLITRGEFGKLNQKYSCMVLLTAREEFDAHAAAVAKKMLLEQGGGSADADSNIVDNIVRYARESRVGFGERLEFAPQKDAWFDYDLRAWEEGGYRDELARYRKPEGIHYLFHMPDDQQDALELSLKQFAHASRFVCLRKMSEHVRRSDLFYQVSALLPE